MARRLKALFMLLILGLVLPAGGVPQRFCTRSHSFIQQDCCSRDKGCSHCPEEKSPVKPSCVSSAKMVPDGVNPDHQFSIPALAAVILPSFALPEPLEIQLPKWSPAAVKDRGPPAIPPRLYLTHRSLLI